MSNFGIDLHTVLEVTSYFLHEVRAMHRVPYTDAAAMQQVWNSPVTREIVFYPLIIFHFYVVVIVIIHDVLG